jgi:hypothetical protein
MKKYLPHLIAVIVFAVITMVYFAPLFQGMRVKQLDVQHYQGMSKEIQDHREKYHEEPLWTNSMFGGMPAYQISVLYPKNFIGHIDKFLKTVMPVPATIILLSLIGFYLLLVSFKVDPILSIAGAIAFSFSSYFPVIISAGHNPKGYAMAYMAPVVAGIMLTYRGRLWLGAAITAFALALEIDCNHLQITYYLLIIVIFLVAGELYKSFKEGQVPYFVKASAVLVIAAILAVLPNLTNLVLTTEYASYSTRGRSDLTIINTENKTSGLDKDYATQWSYGIGETWTLLVPNFKGGASSAISESKNALKGVDSQYAQYIGGMNAYFGDQPFTSGPVYVGAIICFLFLLGMFIVNDKIKWWLLGATILSIMLSWGKNFMPLTDFFMDYVPGYNKFRAVAMTLVIAQFTMPLVAILAVKEIVLFPEVLKTKRKQLFIALGFTAGLCLLFYILPDPFNTFFAPGEETDLTGQLTQAGLPQNQVPVFLSGIEQARKNIFQADALRSFFFIMLAFTAIYLFTLKKINRVAMFSLLAGLVLIDLWVVDRRYLKDDNYESDKITQGYEPLPADTEILQDKDPDFRVLNTSGTFQDARTSYFHKSVGGYHGAKMKRYQELFDFQISKNNMEVLNMLNTKYIIVSTKEGGQMAQRNPAALGNAWFVRDVKVVANADSEITALTNFKAAETAVVDKRWNENLNGFKPSYDSTGIIKLDSYKANDLVYTSSSSSEQLAVFSEIFYDKGWNAYVDGKLTPHFRANYVLRAMRIPAGKHKVEFKFEPSFYSTGQSIALASSSLVIILLLAAFFFEYRRRPEENVNA